MKDIIIKYLNKQFLTSEYHFSNWVVLDRYNGSEESLGSLVRHICTVFGQTYPSGEINSIINKWWSKKQKKFEIHEHRQNFNINPKHNY
jgi:hypothetical protein